MFGLEQLPRSLAAALRDAASDKARIRVSALGDLARHATGDGAAEAVQAMIAALADVSAEVRGAAAIALADAAAKDAVDALLATSEDANQRVRQMALIALGEFGGRDDVRVVRVIRGALGDAGAALRFQGLIAASTLGLPFAEEALVRGTHDVDDEVRHVSLRLLEERSTLEGLHVAPSDTVRRAARERLVDPSLRVRLAAAILLGRAGDRSGAAVVTEGVDASGASLDPDDEQAAIVLAGELELREAVPGLERRAFRSFGRGTAFAYEARIALARMGDARARAAIVRALSAFTRDTRTLAVVAAGRARIDAALPLIEAMRADERRAEPSAVEDALVALRGNGRRALG